MIAQDVATTWRSTKYETEWKFLLCSGPMNYSLASLKRKLRGNKIAWFRELKDSNTGLFTCYAVHLTGLCMYVSVSTWMNSTHKLILKVSPGIGTFKNLKWRGCMYCCTHIEHNVCIGLWKSRWWLSVKCEPVHLGHLLYIPERFAQHVDELLHHRVLRKAEVIT